MFKGITGASENRGNGYYKVLYIDKASNSDVLVTGEKNRVGIYDVTDVSRLKVCVGVDENVSFFSFLFFFSKHFS